MSNRDVNGAIEWLAGQAKTRANRGPVCVRAPRGMRTRCRRMAARPSKRGPTWRTNTRPQSPRTRMTNSGRPSSRGHSYSTGGTYGHAWVADSDETAWSVDYKRHGKIGPMPHLPSGWSGIHTATVGYITGAQYYADNKHTFKGLQSGYWDGKIPPLENIKRPTLTATSPPLLHGGWRAGCRTWAMDIGNQPRSSTSSDTPPAPCEQYNAKWAPDMAEPATTGRRPTTASLPRGSRTRRNEQAPAESCGGLLLLSVTADMRIPARPRLESKMTHLFDLGDYEQPPPKAPVHACAGAYCRVCASSSSGSEAKRRGTAAVKRDEAWWADAALFLDGLDRQEIFTVDDLRESIGEPQGSGNQFDRSSAAGLPPTRSSTTATGRPGLEQPRAHGPVWRRHERHDTHQPQARLCPLLRGMGRR